MTNLEIAKQVIWDNIGDAECGIFNTRNIAGDPMATLYEKDGLCIDICYEYEYFEVFGLTEEEFGELTKYYREAREDRTIEAEWHDAYTLPQITE